MYLKKNIRKYPAACYFFICFFISWLGAFSLVAPKLFSGQQIEKFDGLLMFPVMLTGPLLTSLVLIRIIDGKKGTRELWRRVVKFKIDIKWYAAAILIPPC